MKTVLSGDISFETLLINFNELSFNACTIIIALIPIHPLFGKKFPERHFQTSPEMISILLIAFSRHENFLIGWISIFMNPFHLMRDSSMIYFCIFIKYS